MKFDVAKAPCGPGSQVYGVVLGDHHQPTLGDTLLKSPYLPKVGMVVAAYHGVRRNNGSLLWGAIWGVAGMLAPLIVPAIAVAQGYGQRKSCP